jgi:hypothetical protein
VTSATHWQSVDIKKGNIPDVLLFDLVIRDGRVFSTAPMEIQTFTASINSDLPVPVPARSKAYVYGRPPAAIVGSNPTGGICLLCV